MGAGPPLPHPSQRKGNPALRIQTTDPEQRSPRRRQDHTHRGGPEPPASPEETAGFRLGSCLPQGQPRSHGPTFLGPTTAGKPVSGLLPRLQDGLPPVPPSGGLGRLLWRGPVPPAHLCLCLVGGPQPGVYLTLHPQPHLPHCPLWGNGGGLNGPRQVGAAGRRPPPEMSTS